MSPLSRLRPYVLPTAMIASVLVILVPLPTPILDLLLVANVTAAVLILLSTIFVRTPLDLSVFPSLLLVTTLARLVLNVATTRLILSRAHLDGAAAAGGVVRAFGDFVAGGEIVVGLVIFAIIVLIQFLVITKGATRIGEVAARFSLDGMPGRQLAIDADLNAGVIDHAEAQRRRAEVSQRADFYGAMDGASKFVRGDAVAGICITMVNIVGGLAIGVVQSGMSLSEATTLYTRLTVGDGLVSQIPAFLISLAAGLLITRSAEETNLPEQVLDQLLLRREVLFVAAGFLALLTFTHLPAVPLLLSAAACAVLGWYIEPQADSEAPQDSEPEVAPAQPARPEKRIEDFLKVEPLELEIGVGLLRLADPKRGGDLLERISTLRQRIAAELGIVLPKVRIRDNLRLDDHEYRVKISNTPVATGVCLPHRFLAVDRGHATGTMDGIPHRCPEPHHHAVWISAAVIAEAEALGYVISEPPDVLIEHLRTVVSQFAHELLSRDATQHLLNELSQTQPTVVAELVPEILRLGEVQLVLRALLQESVSIRPLGTVLETLCDFARQTRDPRVLAEHVRQRLGRNIVQALQDDNGTLHVVKLDEATEAWLADRLCLSAQGSGTSSSCPLPELSPLEAQRTSQAIARACHTLVKEGHPPVVLAKPALRPGLRQVLVAHQVQVHVLSTVELPAGTEVSVGGVAAPRHVADHAA
ncbi:MAG: FHIPEP family type III secretion protein [Planctomycetales bacterium]|nr:FHIPEP family type III secretion protein [Planctomycetales bacterium]